MLSRYLVSQVKQNSYFLCGLAIGLWVALVMVPLDEDLAACASVASSSPTSDEYEPQREERPVSNLAQISGSRSVQRPRYYSTELGMRGSLLAAVMTSQEALDTRAQAINHTAAQLQPGLRFFITASSLEASPGRANVVGFTDAREMLKPFHALKYLADNYLEEYNFFFLVSDTAFVNAPRLKELVSKLSVSQDVYMGLAADDDSHYCSLEGGILISNSVLRAVHSSLDWCVRNSYSPHHHENLGRCVLHASQTACTNSLQGQTYSSAQLHNSSLAAEHAESLAEAVTVRPVNDVTQYYQLHSYISRVHLQHSHSEIARLTSDIDRARRRPPPGYRNVTWPRGMRDDPGLAPPVPPSRFDHLRWTLFNSTHAFFPDDHHAVMPLAGASKRAIDLVLRTASAWLRGVGADPDNGDVSGDVTLVEGAWRWTPATSLTYRLLMRDSAAGRVRQLELVKPLGSARLVPVRYVTESASVVLVLPVTGGAGGGAGSAVPGGAWGVFRRVVATDKNAEMIVVFLRPEGVESAPSLDAARAAVAALKDASIRTVDATLAPGQPPGNAALRAATPLVSRDALLLLVADDVEFNAELLNRVRMNTIPGAQWYLPVPFARFAQYNHPGFRDAAGNKPQVNTGRFDPGTDVFSVYRGDLEKGPSQLSCLHSLRDRNFTGVNLGARHSLAKLKLETDDSRTL